MPAVVLLRGAAATVLTVAAALLGPAQVAPATAAGFCAGAGVHVVVDFKELGGGAQRGCDPQGADRAASSVFPAAGFPLTYTQQQAGFVCRVSGKPASDQCQKTPPADAYWGLWWSDGTSGTWTYSSQGVGSLKVPSGGAVAFSWNDSEGASPPGIAPPKDQPTPEPSPTPKPSPKPSPTKQPAPGPAPTAGPAGPTPTEGPGASIAGGPTPSAGAPRSTSRSEKPERQKRARTARSTAGPTPSSSAMAGASPSAAPSEDVIAVVPADASSDAAPAGEDRLPLWVPLGGLGLAVAGTAGAVVVRRRSGATG